MGYEEIDLWESGRFLHIPSFLHNQGHLQPKHTHYDLDRSSDDSKYEGRRCLPVLVHLSHTKNLTNPDEKKLKRAKEVRNHLWEGREAGLPSDSPLVLL